MTTLTLTQRIADLPDELHRIIVKKLYDDVYLELINSLIIHRCLYVEQYDNSDCEFFYDRRYRINRPDYVGYIGGVTMKLKNHYVLTTYTFCYEDDVYCDCYKYIHLSIKNNEVFVHRSFFSFYKNDIHGDVGYDNDNYSSAINAYIKELMNHSDIGNNIENMKINYIYDLYNNRTPEDIEYFLIQPNFM
jgi:hypothetical protein